MATITYKENQNVIVKDTIEKTRTVYALEGTQYKCGTKAISSKQVPDRVYDLLNN